MQWGVLRCDPDDGVRAPVPRIPVDLPDVETSGVAETASDAVGALCHRVPVDRQWIVILDEYIQRSIVGIPRVAQLDFRTGWRHVEKEIQAWRLLKLGAVERVIEEGRSSAGD